MAYTHYERLSAVDATFLEIEDHDVHMHVGAVALFEPGTLRTPDGAIDIERLRDFVESALHENPRFRQKLASVPLFDHPVWVDDHRFNLDYHVRHSALAPPGSVRQLKRLAGRILSQKLDRGKPLWEMWVIEGLADGRFGVIAKAHHCMVDGIGGIDLFAAMLSLEPDPAPREARRWLPRPPPSTSTLLRDEVFRRAFFPITSLGDARRTLWNGREALRSLRESVAGLGEAIGAGLAPTTATPLNPRLGPYRRFDWTTMDLERVRGIRKHLGGTLNDVVLSTVAGAVNRFLSRRAARVNGDTVFRVMVPVSIRKDSQRGDPGNRVVNFLARLPVEIRDPRERLARTIETMQTLKRSRLVRGAEVLEEISDHTFTGLIVQFVRLAAKTRAYNMVVTNVPGPPRPVYLLEARMQEIFPLVPLFHNQGLGIALFSYNGTLSWGFNADWDTLPDLHDFVEDLEAEFESLGDAASAVRSGQAKRETKARQ